MLRLHRKQDEQMDETVKKFDIVPVQSVIWIGDEKIEIDVDERGFQRARKADEDPHLYFVNDRIRAAFVHQLGDKFRKLTYKEQEEMINRKKYGDEGYERRQEKDKNMFTSSHSDRKKTYERIRKKTTRKTEPPDAVPKQRTLEPLSSTFQGKYKEPSSVKSPVDIAPDVEQCTQVVTDGNTDLFGRPYKPGHPKNKRYDTDITDWFLQTCAKMMMKPQ